MTDEQQLPLFEDQDVPSQLTPWARLPKHLRAGTKLHPRWIQPIKVGNKIHGWLDTYQRIYQSGGESKNFIYWKNKVVSVDLRVWVQIKDKADWIEMLDHDRNECWRIAAGKALKHTSVYDAGYGQRVGVPMALWDIVRADGKVVRIGER
jgi:hypothetical protein